MAGLYSRIPFGPVQLVASTAKTVIAVKAAGANTPTRVLGYSLDFDDTTNTDAHIEIRELTVTGFGSGGTSVTPQKKQPSMAETPQTTATRGPTTGAWGTDPDASGATVLMIFGSPPTTNFVQGPFRAGQEILIAGGTYWAIDCKPGSTVCNVRGYVDVEE